MPVICVSGQPGCGTSTVAKLLAQKLKLKYFSPGQYFKSQSKEKETLAAVNVWRTQRGASKGFHEDIDGLQRALAEEGNIVIDGKLSIRMIKNADLKVWLKASTKKRTERIMKRDSIGYEEASAQLIEKETLERDSWKRIYGFDYFEQEKEANFVLDVSDLNPEQTADKIIKFMNREF